MNKICTSLEQSKKLIELGIDRTTADMYYSFDYNIEEYDEDAQIIPKSELGQHFSLFPEDIPTWSLTALMNLLPSEFTEVGKYSEIPYKIDIRKYALTDDVDIYQIAYGNYHWHEDGSCSWSDIINTGEKEDSLDAVFEMIVWLKENGKL